MHESFAELELLLEQEESNLTQLGKERISELKELLKNIDSGEKSIS